MKPINLAPLIRAERKYWRQVRRSIMHPLPLLYYPPVIFGASVEDMTHWQAAASCNEERMFWNTNLRARLQQLKRQVIDLRDSLRH